jgi:hypothetical protein
MLNCCKNLPEVPKECHQEVWYEYWKKTLGTHVGDTVQVKLHVSVLCLYYWIPRTTICSHRSVLSSLWAAFLMFKDNSTLLSSQYGTTIAVGMVEFMSGQQEHCLVSQTWYLDPQKTT